MASLLYRTPSGVQTGSCHGCDEHIHSEQQHNVCARTTTGWSVSAQSSKLPIVSLPKRSLRVPNPSALRSWYVRASEPMTPAFLLCLPMVFHDAHVLGGYLL